MSQTRRERLWRRLDEDHERARARYLGALEWKLRLLTAIEIAIWGVAIGFALARLWSLYPSTP